MNNNEGEVQWMMDAVDRYKGGDMSMRAGQIKSGMAGIFPLQFLNLK
jgi:hypothetical protein